MRIRKLFLRCIVILLFILCISVGNNGIFSRVYQNEPIKSISEEKPVEIISQNTIIDIINENEIIVEEDISIRNINNSQISYVDYLLNQSYKDLQIQDNEGLLDFDPLDEEGLIKVYLRSNLNHNQSVLLRVTYNLDKELPKVEGKPSYFYFHILRYTYYFTYSHIVTIRLPRNSFIHEFDDYSYSFFPINATRADTGNRFYITWEFNNLLAETVNQIFVWFDEPINTRLLLFWSIFGPLLGLALGSFSVFILMRRKEKSRMIEIEKIFLSENQQLILKLIDENGGRLLQKEVIELSGFTKSRVSRNLNILEERQLIIKERWGRGYKCFITETGKKVVK